MDAAFINQLLEYQRAQAAARERQSQYRREPSRYVLRGGNYVNNPYESSMYNNDPSIYYNIPTTTTTTTSDEYPLFVNPNTYQRPLPRQRQVRKPQQQMYVVDRFGNLYPYEGEYEEEEEEEVQQQQQQPVQYEIPKREVTANDIIKMLLGGEESKESEPAENEKQPEETGPTPLTREGLAEILSHLSNAEFEEQAKEEDEKKDDEGTTATTIIPPPVIRKASIKDTPIPSLKVHKTIENKGDKETSKESSSSSAPIIIDDVKVSAPQLNQKDLPFSPAVNIYEFKSKYIVNISLPGVSKEFVDIDFHPTNNELIIKGEIKNKYLSDDDNEANSFILKLSEQRFGNFQRIIKLPNYPGIEDNKISAKFNNGVLEIKLPKIDESKIVKTAKKISLEEVPDEELERESSTGFI